MPDLNLDLDYFEHRKTVRLVGLLGRGAEVLPIKLWSYCGKFHAEDGNLTGYSPEEIETRVGWWGKPGDAVKALCTCGFLEQSNGGYAVHDWQDKQGHLGMFKRKARVAAIRRWEIEKAKKMLEHEPSIAPSNAQTMLEHCPNAPSSTNVTNQPALPASQPTSTKPPVLPKGVTTITQNLPMAAATAGVPESTLQNNPDALKAFERFCGIWRRWPEDGLKKLREKAAVKRFFDVFSPDELIGVIEDSERYWDTKQPTFNGHYPAKWLAETYGAEIQKRIKHLVS